MNKQNVSRFVKKRAKAWLIIWQTATFAKLGLVYNFFKVGLGQL